MGAQISAHLANAGYAVHLLDLNAQAAREGLERARKLKPDPFFTPEALERIQTGGFDTHLDRISHADWIIEAVIEQADAKRALLERVDGVRRPGSIISSNTSGLSITGLSKSRSDDFRRHWLGTHFFNPPRYLPLLELIPTDATDPAVVAAVREFADLRLGKNVVVAKDTPGFIANHVAMHGLVRIFEALAAGQYTVEEIDAITGPAIGRPKSATFRTVDIAGLDILVHVAHDLATRLPAGRGTQFTFPSFVHKMLERGWIGEKAGRGFYERRKNEAGETDIWVLDPASMEYRPRLPVKLPSLDATAPLPLPERMRKLFEGSDRVAAFFQSTLPPSLRYTEEIAPEIAYSIDDIDRAMQWGYGWPLGPFEIADAIGLNEQPFRTAPLAPPGPEFDILRSARDRQMVVAS
jgi:3-hydroxyacyl-CoA dehydrogenase